MRVLVIAAHPDDEVLGVGGSILRHVASGDEVYLCIVTQAYTPQWSEEVIANKREEVERASRILGVKETFFCGFPTVKLNLVAQIDLNQSIERVINKVKPHMVYCPPKSDINRDHHIVFEATLVACRPQPGGTVRHLLCYDIPPSTRYGGPFSENAFLPNYYTDIISTLHKKLIALAQYETGLKVFPHPRSLEGYPIVCHGARRCRGLEAAEAFCLVREISADEGSREKAP